MFVLEMQLLQTEINLLLPLRQLRQKPHFKLFLVCDSLTFLCYLNLEGLLLCSRGIIPVLSTNTLGLGNVATPASSLNSSLTFPFKENL